MVSEVAGGRPDGDPIAKEEDINPPEEGMLPVTFLRMLSRLSHTVPLARFGCRCTV